MIRFRRKQPVIASAVVEEIISVPLAVMDERFSRAAGRFCGHCGIYGSHHTATHNDFARAALKRRELHY